MNTGGEGTGEGAVANPHNLSSWVPAFAGRTREGTPAPARPRCRAGRPVLTPPPMPTYLDFERPISELAARIEELRETAEGSDLNIGAEIDRLEAKSERMLRETYAKLTPWQKTQVARHPDRPHFKDYM